MKNIVLQETINSSRVDNLQITQRYVDDIWSENKEHTVDCPDCFDTMVKVYNYDKAGYQCENCDLVIPGMSVQGFD